MLKERVKRLSLLLLSTALLITPIPQASFAANDTYRAYYEYTGTLPQAVMETLPEDTTEYPDQT